MPYLDSVASRSRFVITWVSELLNGIIKGLLRPSSTSILIASVVDLTRSKPDLIAENALLRHQLTLLKRQSKRPVVQRIFRTFFGGSSVGPQAAAS